MIKCFTTLIICWLLYFFLIHSLASVLGESRVSVNINVCVRSLVIEPTQLQLPHGSHQLPFPLCHHHGSGGAWRLEL